MKTQRKKEGGYVIVEATIVYPIVVMVFFVILYAAMFIYHKANLQASIENALIYFKNQRSDSYVEIEDRIKKETTSMIGNKYNRPEFLFPYRHGFQFLVEGTTKVIQKLDGSMENDEGVDERLTEDFKKYFNSSYDIDISEIKVIPRNFYFFKEIEVRAVKKIKTSLNLAMVGGLNEIEIKAIAKVVVVDGDNFIRDVDYVTFLLEDTKFGKSIKEIKQKIIEGYEKIKDKFDI